MVLRKFLSFRFLVVALGSISVTSIPSVLAHSQPQGQLPTTVLGVECSRVFELGIDKQTNLLAGMIMVGCGLAEGGKPSPEWQAGAGLVFSPSTNVDTITGTEVYPTFTQSESMVWSSDGQTIVVNYNDNSTMPGNLSGVSVSTDGGLTFTRLLPAPFGFGHGFNWGDPVVVFNAALGKWFAGDLAGGCSPPPFVGRGIGLWTSDDGITWSPGACAHMGANDDRESMWVDNNPDSPFYGRMYISWNDFNNPGINIFVTYSDDGVNWSPPVQVSSNPPGPFRIRNIQLTGARTDGTVFLAAMDEGGGQLNNRTNIIYRSTNGGAFWTGIMMGPPFAPPGDSLCGAPGSYFARIFPIWRHMGWGQPGVGPDGVVHYAYAGAGVNPGDTGDIYYTRSDDNGITWSTPIVLNSDQAAGGTAAQWMPSLSVTVDGKVQVSWYDRRNTTDGTNYEVWGIQSLDNGVTWQPDAPISDVLIPQPEQPDPTIVACYAGDYNYVTAFGNTNYVTWTDGRNPVSGHFQQDVYFARLP